MMRCTASNSSTPVTSHTVITLASAPSTCGGGGRTRQPGGGGAREACKQRPTATPRRRALVFIPPPPPPPPTHTHLDSVITVGEMVSAASLSPVRGKRGHRKAADV